MIHLLRLPYLLTIICIYGLGYGLGYRKDIAVLLKKLGPSFVKLGQTLSVRPDIVGQEIADQLQNLQDNMAPFATHKARQIIEQQLGKPINTLFASFSHTPVAAASIAQVHQATLPDGTLVAVKVLRPSVRRAFKQDIALFYLVARMLGWIPQWQRLRLLEVVQMFEQVVHKELDLRLEAASASELAQHMQADKEVYVPKIYWSHSTERVMVSEWIEGLSIYQTEKLDAEGYDRPAIAKAMYRMFLNQAYRDGFFHADIHPGNLFVDKQGRIVPIDFGIMGRIDDKTKYYVTEILRGFLTQDYEHVADIHFKAGYVPKGKDKGDFTLALRAIGEPILGMPAKDISVANLLGLLFKITADFDMQTQPQLLLLQKTLVLVEGVCKQLDPDINLWECARPWMEAWAKEEYGMQAQIKKKAALIKSAIITLPDRLHQWTAILEMVTHDGIKLHPDTVKLYEQIQKKNRWIYIILGLSIMTLIISLMA